MKIINGGVTSPKGFLAAGCHAGIKYQKKDMALVVSEVPAAAAGVFTTNIVKASPVKWDQKVASSAPYARAMVVNSGVANACTGAQGDAYCRQMAEKTGEMIGAPAESVFVASTGVIGRQLPMEKILPGIETLSGLLSSSREGAASAAEAIMTTDTRSKEVCCTVELGGKTAVIGGMCKGSGMIHPNMATMLCFVTTDAAITHEMLQNALSTIVVDTFNMISVDGDTSTNDSVLLMANGLAGNETIAASGADYDAFCEGLTYIMTELSKMIAGDGEGATCLFEVTVKGASTKEQARILSKAVVCSSLTKAAIFGHDANWGRILCAMGYSGAPFDPDKTDLWFRSEAGELQIISGGVDTGYDEEEATAILSKDHVTAVADIHEGNETATAWGCDLTFDYVRINGSYRS